MSRLYTSMLRAPRGGSVDLARSVAPLLGAQSRAMLATGILLGVTSAGAVHAAVIAGLMEVKPF